MIARFRLRPVTPAAETRLAFPLEPSYLEDI